FRQRKAKGVCKMSKLQRRLPACEPPVLRRARPIQRPADRPPSRRSGALARRGGGKWAIQQVVPQGGMRYANQVRTALSPRILHLTRKLADKAVRAPFPAILESALSLGRGGKLVKSRHKRFVRRLNLW